MITRRMLQDAQHVIIDSGAAEMFRRALAGRRGGRRPTFDQALFLVGMFLAAAAHQRTHVRLIHEVLTQEVPLEQQMAWGIRRILDPQHPEKVWVLSEADLQNVSRSLKRALNHTPAFMPKALLGDLEERARRAQALNDIVDTVIDATKIPRPADAHDYAIDDTGIWAPERAPRAIPDSAVPAGDEEVVGPLVALQAKDGEPQARGTGRRAGRRRATDAAIGAKTRKDGSRQWFFGYSLHALVRVPGDDVDGLRPEPPLVEAVRVTPASTDIVDVSLALIDAVIARGERIRYLLADRHYSYKRADRWLLPLIERGISQVVNLREDDHGFKEWDGMLFVAAHAHCPMTPQHLGVIKQPGKDAPAREWDDFHDLIDERQAYAAQRTLPLNAQGETRWRCPALSGTLGCALRPGTVKAANDLGLPVVAAQPQHLPPICTQNSVGLRATTDEQFRLLKTAQKLYWGTRAQVKLAMRRTFVEGWFGTLKGDSSAGKRRGSSLYTGLAHATIEAGIFAAVANLINLRSWHKETGLGPANNPLLADSQPNYGYRYLTQEEYLTTVQAYDPKAA